MPRATARWFDDPAILALTIASAIGLLLFFAWDTFGARFPIVDLREILVAPVIGVGTIIIFPIRAIPRRSVQTLRTAVLIDAALQLGTIVASALVGTALEHRFALHYDSIRAAETPARLAAIPLPPHTNVAALIGGLAVQQSYVLAFADAAFITGVIALAALPLGFCLCRRGNASSGV